MLTRVVQTVITVVFFQTYFDLVSRFELFQERAASNSVVINPLSVVSEYDQRGIQAIHHAVQLGHLSATMTLIEKFGADINARTTSELRIDDSKVIPGMSTPLIISIITGNFEIFCYLLSKPELDISASTDQFKSPLHFAAEHGQLVMIEALLSRGAKISYLRGTRKSLFHLALEHGKLNVVEWLVDNKIGIGPVSQGKNKALESHFHFLARLKLPIDIWIRSLELCLKSYSNDRKSIINRKSITNQTPLDCAVEEANESAIIGLILNGADLSDANYPLLIAVKGFFSECETGFSPEYINSDNETIWHLIARINSVPLAQAIVHYFPTKPNLLLKNRIEKTALESAMDMENFDIAFEFFKLYDHQIDLDLLENYVNLSIWNISPKLFEILLSEFPGPFNELISTRTTLYLHVLATSSMRNNLQGSKQMAILLITKFPQMMRSLDKLGRTPLHLAYQSDFLEFFNWLKEARESVPELDFNVQDDSGVFFADLLRSEERKDILELLNLK